MPRLGRPLLLSGLLLGLVAQTAYAQTRGTFDPDDPRTRAQWNNTWFGVPTPAYMLFKNRAAAAEIARWGNTFPRKQGLQLPAAALAGPAWTNLGSTQSTVNPYSDFNGDIDSGRPVSIVVDPTDRKTVYLATSGGGVWKSSNADTTSSADWTWTPITDSLPASSGAGGNVSCGALAMSPANHLVLYLALGDAFDAAGTGIYKTADGGTNWTAATVTGATPTRSYQALAVDANTVLVGTNAGLLRSTDGGATFAKIAGSPAGSIWTIQSLDATHLIASSQGTDQGIWYSSDVGATWTAATVTYGAGTTPGRITLATSAASATQGWAEYEDTTSGNIAPGLLKTTDAGHTWTWVAAPTSASAPNAVLFQAESGDGGQGFYNHCLIVDPLNANNVFIGANLDFYRTTDGGANWQWLSSWATSGKPYAHADFHAATWSSDHKLYVGNDGGLALYLDPLRASASLPTAHDATFLDGTRNKGLITHLCYYLGSTQATNAADAKDRISLGLQDNGTRVRVVNGGTLGSSSTFNESIGGDGFGTVWHTADATKALGSIYYNDIQKSVDGGATFNKANTGIAETSSSNAPFVTHLAMGNSTTPDVVYAHANTKVYKSANFAGSWTAMTTTGLPASYIIRNIGASRTTDAVGIASNGGRCFLYYPATSTSWTGSATDITGGALNTGCVWFDTQNDQTVYLTSVAVNSAVHHLWKSANGGGTWTSIDGASGASNGLPFGIPIHTIQNMPGDSNTLFAGTDFGVYKSADAGASWVRFGIGLPLVAARDLYIAPDKTYLRVATFGRGVWQVSLNTTPSVSVSPATANVNVSGTISTFKATATNLAPNTVTWTATAGAFASATTPGDGTTTNNYTAPASITGVTQNVTVTGTGSDGTTTGTATVTVFNPAAVTVSVSPSGAQTVLTGKTVNFTATTNYGNVAWSAPSGSFNPVSTASGVQTVFTAPATKGDVTVTAQSAGTASQTVTVHVKSLDINNDALVDVRDLLALMSLYGKTDTTSLAAGDLNGDGVIDDADLTLFLANF
ncbi:MAG TPA: hypothetical protein VFF76_11435 [Holophagaceae bacterium]|jgi:hypothetical protein|nr:hypothetical protein [Holophagaceae bacterium]